MVSLGSSARNGMIVTRTPLRVSFAGGGTDLPDFYERGYGAVFSTAIDKYIYVTVKRHGLLFHEPIRLNYSKSEQAQHIDELENDIARECLRLLRIDPPIYISTVGDLPASTGLGSSSSFAVGLLHALHVFRRERVSMGQLAEEACHIEIEVLRRPIGKQDQYAAAYGGLNYFCFKPAGIVTVEPQGASPAVFEQLFGSMLLFWTGHQRDSASVLAEQKANTGDRMLELLAIREHACALQHLVRNGHFNVAEFGRVLDEGWRLKRRLASSITNPLIDTWYERAMAAGARGGKVCGAGGGGFLLFLVEPAQQPAVRHALSDLVEVTAGFESRGSQILLPSAE
jgi:D-glycero-alpha-D-manno-heptose-7-phosphate kinase